MRRRRVPHTDPAHYAYKQYERKNNGTREKVGIRTESKSIKIKAKNHTRVN